MFSQYISTSEKITCFHVPTSPPDCSPNSNITQPLDCSTFGFIQPKKYKHPRIPPGIHGKPGSKCETSPPSTNGSRTTDGFTPKRRTQRISSEEKLPKTWRGDVLWKKHQKKKNLHFWEHTMQQYLKKTWSPSNWVDVSMWMALFSMA